MASARSQFSSMLRARWFIFGCFLVVLAVTAASFWNILSGNAAQQISALARENGALEVMHSVLSLLAAVLFYRSWAEGRGAVKVAGGALALLAGGAFFREFDFKHHSGGYEWLRTIASYGLQDIFFVGSLILIAIYLVMQRAYFGGLIRLALRWQAWPFFAAGLLLGGALVADDVFVTTVKGRLFEELAETYGYLFLVLSAWRHGQLVGHPELDVVVPDPVTDSIVPS